MSRNSAGGRSNGATRLVGELDVLALRARAGFLRDLAVDFGTIGTQLLDCRNYHRKSAYAHCRHMFPGSNVARKRCHYQGLVCARAFGKCNSLCARSRAPFSASESSPFSAANRRPLVATLVSRLPFTRRGLRRTRKRSL